MALVPRRTGCPAICDSLERRRLLSVTLSPPTLYGSESSLGSVIVDVNGDGKPDIVATASAAGSSSVDVYLNQGNGTFGPAQAYSCASGSLGASQPYAIAVADVNGDGHPDIVTANFGGTVSVLLNNGDGTFGAATVYQADDELDGVVIGDLNGDGLPDIAVASRLTSEVDLFFNTGGGNFTPAGDLAVDSGPNSLGIADFRNDGRNDLFTANGGGDDLSVLLSNGDGTFGPAENLGAGIQPSQAIAGDFNGDGLPDIATANSSGTVSVLLNQGAGNFAQAVTSPGVTGAFSLATADFNGDGKADLAVVAFNSNLGGILLGNGDGTFQAPTTFTPNLPGGFVSAGDINGDGAPDIIVGAYDPSNQSAELSILINGGSAVSPPPAQVKSIGALDPTFATDGLASHDVGFTSTAGVAEQADGSSVIAGTVGTSPSEEFGLTRYNADGSLDTTFGTNGVVDSSFGGDDVAAAVADVPSSGDILVAGTDTTSSGSQFALAEYTSAGVLDTSFGNGTGYVLTSFSTTAGTLSEDVAHALVVAPNGTIYVAGSSNAGGKGLDFAVASYNADGSANTRFNATGTALLDFAGGDDVINAIALQSNGDLVAAGYSENPSTGIDSIALARFLPTGADDVHFGSKGKVVTNVRGVADVASSVALDKTGKIVIGGLSATGSASDGSLSSDFVVARYTAAGAIDRTFGGGPVTTSFGQPSAVSQVLIESNGDVIASGKTVASLNGLDPDALQVAVARYTPNGKLDTQFNTTGTTIVDLSGASASPAVERAGDGGPFASFALTNFSLSPADTGSTLLAEFMQFEQSAQGVIATTQGGELLDVGNSGVNTVEAAIVTAGIDLAAALVAKLPSAALEGAKESLNLKVTDGGSEAASGAITIQLYASPDAFVDPGATPFASVPEKINLKANQSRSFPLHYTLPGTAGDFYLVANVATGSLSELNPNNNVAASASAVEVAAPFVDLAGSNLTSGNLAAGKNASLTFTVANDGNVTARSAPIELLASPDGSLADATEIVEPKLTLNLPPNVSRKYHASLKLPTTLAANTYVIVIDLDPDNTLNDPNLTNNVIVGTMTFTVG